MTQTDEEIHTTVRAAYARVAVTSSSCCAPDPTALGYHPEELADLPDEAVMGLGCGNPVALADIEEGDTVLDLGSGGGIDVFLAARKTGAAGRVIGVDMTPEMLQRAEVNAGRLGLDNVEFRRGLIEELPVADASVDVTISNCVINLAPDKRRVFAEVLRVLRPGGRLVVSDIVTDGPLPESVTDDPAAWASCVAGALPRDEYLDAMRAAGLTDVDVLKQDGSGPLFSITVRAMKPPAPERSV
ncbi:MAG: arsenite methyltransferase [Acidimicrobiia bacterium]|nr:arsenite methyltransferase [Acidimicrobiia bacterium]